MMPGVFPDIKSGELNKNYVTERKIITIPRLCLQSLQSSHIKLNKQTKANYSFTSSLMSDVTSQ